MNAPEIDAVLRQTLVDERVSASEKKAFAEWLTRNAADENDRAFIRHRAFAIAGEKTNNQGLLDWLEDIVKMTLRENREPVAAASAIQSAAFFSPSEDCMREIIKQFDQARVEVDVCVFTITDDRITSAIERAHRRGIPVRVVTDNDKSHDLGSDIERLLQNGVKCVMDLSPAHMHHKFAIVDRKRLMSGSFNWTRSATMENEENLIVTDDSHLVAEFTRRFEMLWNKWCK